MLKARTEAVQRREKIQFDGFYLTRGHYSSGGTFHDAKTGKIILRTLRTNVSCLSSLANCLGTGPLKMPSLLPVPRKKYFSPQEIIVIAGF